MTLNSVHPAHTLIQKPSSKALMGQLSKKSNPNLPSVGLRYILTNNIKPRSPWIGGGFFRFWDLKLRNFL